MKVLAVYDENNYEDTTEVFEKESIRGIIMRDGKLAMQQSKYGEYKIPGGCREEGETFLQTLVREVNEETGLVVIEDSAIELGEILEVRKDIFDDRTKYICHSYFYFCEVKDEMTAMHLTENEIAKGYVLAWATPEEIYNTNVGITKSAIKRDTAFIKMIIDGQVVLPK